MDWRPFDAAWTLIHLGDETVTSTSNGLNNSPDVIPIDSLGERGLEHLLLQIAWLSHSNKPAQILQDTVQPTDILSQSPPKKTKRDNSPRKGKGKGKANRPTWRPGKFNRRYHKQYVLSRRFFEVGFTSKHTTPTTERIVEKSGCLLTEKCQSERCCNLSSCVSDRSGSVL